jgi:hypothetical protein
MKTEKEMEDPVRRRSAAGEFVPARYRGTRTLISHERRYRRSSDHCAEPDDDTKNEHLIFIFSGAQSVFNRESKNFGGSHEAMKCPEDMEVEL